jgi:uncharacterized protein (TIGR02147 family)
MVEQNQKISVFDYTDYRTYLSDYYKNQKKINKDFSYRFFANKAQIKSSGFYKELIDGKRSLSRSLILKFSYALKLTKKEAEYFENMVYFNESKTVEEKKLYFKKMMASYDSKAYKLLSDQYEYFSKWYYVVIHELLSYIKFKDDYKKLANTLSPTIRPDQVKKTIEILTKLKLIKTDQEGYYHRCDKVLTTGYPKSEDRRVSLLNIINFQKEMINLADKAYNTKDIKSIDMSTLTLCISKETYHEMKEEIANFRKKLLGMADKDKKPDMVYELNYQFFPLSKWKKGGLR